MKLHVIKNTSDNYHIVTENGFTSVFWRDSVEEALKDYKEKELYECVEIKNIESYLTYYSDEDRYVYQTFDSENHPEFFI